MPNNYNPYTADTSTIQDDVPQYSLPRGTYAAPGIDDGAPYIDAFGWGPELHISTTQTPSAQRLGSIPRYSDYPNPEQPPEVFYDTRDADKAHRESTTSGQSGTFQELKGLAVGDLRWADNPRRKPPAEPRITDKLAPTSYSFTRPFDQLNRTHDGDPATGTTRQFNGTHFSMADHRRNYPAVGTMPQKSARNTFRLMPTPWDTDVVDMPPNNGTPDTPLARIQSVEVPGPSSMAGTRSFRLS